MKKLFTLIAVATMALTASAEDKVISEETTWNFSELTAGTIEVVTESNGLYYRAGTGGRAITVASGSNLTWTFSDASTFKSGSGCMSVGLPANTAVDPAGTLNASDNLGEALSGSTDANNRTIAFTTGKAGTVYVAYRGAKTGAEGKSYKLFFRATGSEEYAVASSATSEDVAAAANQQGTLLYNATAAGTFVIGGNTAMSIYMIKFVPAPEATTWNFNALEAGSLTTEQKYQDLGGGLMFTGSATGEFQLKELAEPLAGIFSDGTAWSASKYVNLPANTGNWTGAFSSRRQAGADGDDSNSTFRRAIAFNATKKGTFYVIFGAASEVADKLFEVYASYNDGSSNTYSTESTAYATGPVEVKLECDYAATFWARGTQNGTRIYAVRFVPEGAATGIQTINAAAPAKADGAWYTISGQRVAQPTKGLYIHNGKKYVVK